LSRDQVDTPGKVGAANTATSTPGGAVLPFPSERRPDGTDEPPGGSSLPDTRSAAHETLTAAKALGRHLGVLLLAVTASGIRKWRALSSRFPARIAWLGQRSRQLVKRPDIERQISTTGRPRPGRWIRRTRLVAVGLSWIAVGLFVLGFLAYSVATLPLNGGLQVEATQSALTLQSDRGESFATRGVFKGEKLTAADLPPHLAQAIVAIEDRRFNQHSGLDLRGMVRAAWRNAQAGATREGGSTITQQLARLMFLSSERSLRRKTQEALLALWLETQLSKEEILLRYLNTAFFGAGAYGVDAAAKRYFGKRAKELSLAEAAMLAGLVRAPSQLAPTRNFGGARERADAVLQAMVEIGAITPQQADAARAQPVTLRTPPETPPGTNYFVDMVTADVRRLLGGASGDATLRTTLNLELQRLAEGVIERRLEAEGTKKNVSQAALVAMAPDGAIIALVGGRDYEQSQFNRAVQAKRQTGSLFKLFVYLAAFQRGYTPQSVLVDRPIQIGDWEPQNYGGRFRGPVTLRTAFTHSINTIAVQLAEEVGIPAVIDTAKRMGLQSNMPAVPSLALGAAEATLMEMTRAFAAVAAGVESIEPYAVRTIQGGSQQALYTRPRAGPEVIGQLGQSRVMILDLLQAVVNEGTGRAARLANVPAAGKTGTTQEHRDAWFVGFTPDLIVGVWVGNDDNTPMNKVVGGDMPAAIWRDFVERAGLLLARKAAIPAVAQSSTPSNTKSPVQTSARPERPLRGVPEVLDTGTLAIDGAVVRLQGVEGEAGRMAQQLTRFLRRREVACAPAGDNSGAYRCRVGGEDLAELIVGGGGARAKSDAPPELLAAEEQARSERLGIWRRYR
jgi:penicillin-binding protein 1A